MGSKAESAVALARGLSAGLASSARDKVTARTGTVQVVRYLRQVCAPSAGGGLQPRGPGWLLLCLRGLERAGRDLWGSCQLASWLVQVRAHGGFHDPTEPGCPWVVLRRVQLLATVAIPTKLLPPRLLSAAHLIAVGAPRPPELERICEAYLRGPVACSLAPEQLGLLASSMVGLLQHKAAGVSDGGDRWTARLLTDWVRGLERYPDTADVAGLLAAWTHEARRLLRDPMPDDESRNRLEAALADTLRSHWAAAQHALANGWDAVPVREWLELAAHADWALGRPSGWLLSAGASGTGRRLAILLAANRAGLPCISPRGRCLAASRADLRALVQEAGLDGRPVVLLLEEQQLDSASFDLLASLWATGEVPGLFRPDELDLASLPRDHRTPWEHLCSRVQRNVRVALVVDAPGLLQERHPWLLKATSAHWITSWSRESFKQLGIAKLNEAKKAVAELEGEATTKRKLLAEKQAEADAALQQIGASMSSTGEQKTEMEQLRATVRRESERLMQRKQQIDRELAQIEPLVKNAQQAVGNIRSDALSEIRSLRAPPDVIRDILEGVLRLMGTFDTSWVSMKRYVSPKPLSALQELSIC
ncbi:hypothetical protein HPB48_010888 [Haemaphysalis longicornis]|uniref:Dynein heavy chain AAA module D4 domain-containing protein n=1 Tax=Haemaphysalis longicornis TaxID=44386 RepID=A0A9J6G7G2_HAELO|nr:hypothetical protein HPB48_010888 [Haemaphysalis longicornis]